MKLETLFSMLSESDGESMTVIPRDANKRPIGVVVLVKDEAAQEFLQYLETFWESRNQRPTPIVNTETNADDYGWSDE